MIIVTACPLGEAEANLIKSEIHMVRFFFSPTSHKQSPTMSLPLKSVVNFVQ